MNDNFVPKSKRERKNWNYHAIGATGKLPWSVRGIEECMRHIHKRASDLTAEERKDWDPMIEVLVFVKEKYGRNKGSAHFLRMGHIISFVEHYRDRLKRDKLVTPIANDGVSLDDNLVRAFATLPFTMSSFRYDDVEKYVQSCKKPS
jgi:hypothetical protein